MLYRPAVIDERWIELRPRNLTERCYAVRTSGHGSGYVASEPEVFNKTYLEAEAEVMDFEIRADTIGGQGIIVRDPSKRHAS